MAQWLDWPQTRRALLAPDEQAINAKTQQLFDEMRLNLDPRAKWGDLTVAEAAK